MRGNTLKRRSEEGRLISGTASAPGSALDVSGWAVRAETLALREALFFLLNVVTRERDSRLRVGELNLKYHQFLRAERRL